MSDRIVIPDDMRIPEIEELIGGQVCSVRDFLILLGEPQDKDDELEPMKAIPVSRPPE